MTWVKVCGLTEQEHVAAAVAAGADAIGLVLVPESPRAISVERAADLADGTPLERIVLTVGIGPHETLELLDRVGATGVQPYDDDGSVSAAAAAAGHLVLRPFHPGDRLPPRATRQIPLVDSRDASRRGGTGRTFDWNHVADIEDDFVLAGGLGPDNVRRAISKVAPWGVDASSGLESSRGVKDPALIRAFVQEVKST